MNMLEGLRIPSGLGTPQDPPEKKLNHPLSFFVATNLRLDKQRGNVYIYRKMENKMS